MARYKYLAILFFIFRTRILSLDNYPLLLRDKRAYYASSQSVSQGAAYPAETETLFFVIRILVFQGNPILLSIPAFCAAV